MPDEMRDVRLNVKEGSTEGDGWTNVTASNGEPYQYKYTGGMDNRGNKEYDADGTARHFDVVFSGPDGRTYQFVGFINQTAPSDLSGEPRDNGMKVGVTDKCENEGDFKYSAIVGIRKDDGAAPDVIFLCDPVVRNKPGQG